MWGVRGMCLVRGKWIVLMLCFSIACLFCILLVNCARLVLWWWAAVETSATVVIINFKCLQLEKEAPVVTMGRSLLMLMCKKKKQLLFDVAHAAMDFQTVIVWCSTCTGFPRWPLLLGIPAKVFTHVHVFTALLTSNNIPKPNFIPSVGKLSVPYWC